MLYNYLVELLCAGIGCLPGLWVEIHQNVLAAVSLNMSSPKQVKLSPLKFTDLADWCCTVEPRLLQDPSPGSLEAPGKMVIGCDRQMPFKIHIIPKFHCGDC